MPLTGSFRDGRLTAGGRDEAVSGRWHVVTSGARLCAAAVAAALSGGDALRALSACPGPFVLAAWDRESRRGLIARDGLGGRTLHVARRGRDLHFAEELPDLLERLPATPGPDVTSVASWLGSNAIPVGRSLYAGIERLPPGHLIRLRSDAAPVMSCWWRLDHADPLGLEREALAEEAWIQVAAATARTLGAADRPGVLTSGGLDSSGVLAAATALRAQTGVTPPVAYSAVFPDHPGVDESALIDALTGALGVPSVRTAFAHGDAAADSLAHLERWRQPETSPNAFLWRPVLAGMAEDGCDLVLDGEGGDELFGAQPWLLADLLARGRLRSALAQTAALPGGHRAGRRRRLLLLLTVARQAAAPRALQRARRRHRPPATVPRGLLTIRGARLWRTTYDPFAWRDLDGPVWSRRARWAMTQERERLDAAGHLSRRARDAGLADGHPLLFDADLVAWCARIPPAANLDPRRDRPVLRAAMAGQVPEALRTRTGKAFFDPLTRAAVEGRVRDRAWRLLAVPGARVREWVAGSWIEDALAGTLASHPGVVTEMALFRVAALEDWLRSLEDPGWAGAERERLPPTPRGEPSVRRIAAT